MSEKAYTPSTVPELKQHVADVMGLEPEELRDTKLCKELGINRSRFNGWAANQGGVIPAVARPDVRKALVRLRAKYQDEALIEPVEEREPERHSYVARGFYFTGAEFLKLDPETQRRVLAIVEAGKLQDLAEPPKE